MMNMSVSAKHFLMKLASKMRKHLAMETVSTFTLRNLYISSLNELLKVYGPERGVQTLFRWGFEMGHEYMLELRRDIERLKPRVDAPPIARIAWYTFAGHDLSGVEARWLELDGKRFYMLRFWDEKCPWCMGLTLERKVNVCSYPAGAYEGAYQTASYFTNLNNFAMVRELKCRSTGDPYCEFYIADIPVEVLDDVAPRLEEVFPGFYSQLGYEFSKSLRELIV